MSEQNQHLTLRTLEAYEARRRDDELELTTLAQQVIDLEEQLQASQDDHWAVSERLRECRDENTRLLEQLETTQAELTEWRTSIATERLQEQLEVLRTALVDISEMPGVGMSGTGAAGWLTTHALAPKRAQEALDAVSNPASIPKDEA